LVFKPSHQKATCSGKVPRLDHYNEGHFTGILNHKNLHYLWLVFRIISITTSQGIIVFWKVAEIITHRLMFSC